MVVSSADAVIVVSGGIAEGEFAGIDLPPAGYVIAADSGARTALELGLRVDELIGDLDSVPAAARDWVRESGGRVERYPVAKDATDLELALAAAVSRTPAPRRLLVLGSAGGRLDHLLGGALLLASPAWAGADATCVPVIEAWLGRAKITVVRGRAELSASAPGELVSLLAAGGPARGVTLSGLLYELRDAELAPGTTLGISNEFTGKHATVQVREGVVLAVQPGVLGTHYLEGRA
jgi:thiamine pyrophosphokinase